MMNAMGAAVNAPQERSSPVDRRRRKRLADGSQLDSATPGMGFGPIASFSEPSVSFRSGEKLLMLNLFSGLGTTR